MSVKWGKRETKGVPEDELMLAEMLGAARSRGLKWHSGSNFITSEGFNMFSECKVFPGHGEIVGCCAMGAARLAGVTVPSGTVWGNDNVDSKGWVPSDAHSEGETLGYAFACAMRKDEV